MNNDDVNPYEYNFDHKYITKSISIDISKDGIMITKEYISKETGKPVTIIHQGKDYKDDIVLLHDMMEIDLYNER